MKYIEKVTAWFKARKEEKVREANERNVRESEERVQLREFKGGIYIALDEIPVVAVSSHINEAIEALEDVRKTVLQYINQPK